MERTQILSLNQIRDWLRLNIKRRSLGDSFLPTVQEIANRAGLHRDTVNALMAGDHVETRTQYGLSRVIREIEQDTATLPRSKVMCIRISGGMPQIRIGLDSRKFLA